MTIREIMTTDLVVVGPEASLKEVADLILQHEISGIPVVKEDGKLAGLVCDVDLVPKDERVPYTSKRLPSLFSEFVSPDKPLEAYERLEQFKAADVMRVSFPSVAPGDDITQAAAALSREEVRQVPVIENGRIVGIVTRKDLIRGAAGSDHK